MRRLDIHEGLTIAFALAATALGVTVSIGLQRVETQETLIAQARAQSPCQGYWVEGLRPMTLRDCNDLFDWDEPDHGCHEWGDCDAIASTETVLATDDTARKGD